MDSQKKKSIKRLKTGEELFQKKQRAKERDRQYKRKEKKLENQSGDPVTD